MDYDFYLEVGQRLSYYLNNPNKVGETGYARGMIDCYELIELDPSFLSSYKHEPLKIGNKHARTKDDRWRIILNLLKEIINALEELSQK